MKRDLELIRNLLLAYGCYDNTVDLPSSLAKYEYHQQLLLSAGYKRHYYCRGGDERHGLTHEGQEVAAILANDVLWREAKETFAVAGFESVPLQVLLDWMKAKMEAEVNDEEANETGACA